MEVAGWTVADGTPQFERLLSARRLRYAQFLRAELGLEQANRMEVRVLDSTAHLRYLVLPRRPAGTDNMNEQELAGLVTWDSMIGVTAARTPEPSFPR